MEQNSACCVPKKVSNSLEAAEGFYRRPLPSSTCVAFESAQGRTLFKEALENGTSRAERSLSC